MRKSDKDHGASSPVSDSQGDLLDLVVMLTLCKLAAWQIAKGQE